MLQLKNRSPFVATINLFPNEKGIDHLYVIIKATFAITDQLEIAAEQLPIHMTDEYWGAPEKSSLKRASECHLTKPNTDILMMGSACTQDKRPVRALDVMLSVAHKTMAARVIGDRVWDSGMLGLKYSDPVPFEFMPLVYERAFGGIHDADRNQQNILSEARNPVGRGFKGKRSKNEFKGMALPNIEDPTNLISHPGDQASPVGFGPIAPSWEPRRFYAGTYDEAWQKNQAPYLPTDFNNRFFNTAHPELVCDGFLQGGEPVTIVNMSEKGRLQFNLPVCDIDLKIRVAGKIESPQLNLETVLLEPNLHRFSMTWRASLPCDKKALKVEQIDVVLNRWYLG